MKIIALEEHYWDAELSKTYTGVESGRPGPQRGRIRVLRSSCESLGVSVQSEAVRK